MANKVPAAPTFPKSANPDVSRLNRALYGIFVAITQRLNNSLHKDGSEPMTGQLTLKSYAVADLPSAATAGGLIYVSDETGGAVPAFSDGTNWRRVQDRAIVS